MTDGRPRVAETSADAGRLARLARTVVAASHTGVLWAGGQTIVTGYVDDDGEPVILAPALPSQAHVRVAETTTSHDVSCSAFASAEPDLWHALGPAVVQHLNKAHGDVLARIAQVHVRSESIVAAGVSRMSPDGVDLAVVTPRGASTMHLALTPPLGEPHDMCTRLGNLAQARPTAGGRDER